MYRGYIDTVHQFYQAMIYVHDFVYLRFVEENILLDIVIGYVKVAIPITARAILLVKSGHMAPD